jgi:hypothetical protein
VDLVCDATNMAAFTAYSRSKQPEHIAALECIKKKCGFFDSKEESGQEAVESAVLPKVALENEVLTNSSCDDGSSPNQSGTCKRHNEL